MKEHEPIPAELEHLAAVTINAAFKVHRALGPGLLESVYEVCLAYEIRQRGVAVETEVKLPVVYEGMTLDAGLRFDLLVGDSLIVEVKAVEELHPVFHAQLPTYLKLTGHRLGLLINFNTPLLKDGIRRVVL